MKNRGFSIPELLIVSFIFSIFMVVSYLILSQGMAVWSKTESSQNVSFQLQKARAALRRDLLQASRVELETTGDLLWFLTSISSQGGQAQHDDGRPFWQRNTLYYLAKPLNHQEIFQTDCGTDPGLCPHKILIRKIVDTGVPTTPDGLTTAEEQVMTSQAARSFATAPSGLYPSPEEGVESVDVIATGLLSLSFAVNPKGVSPGEVEVTLKGFDLTKGHEKVRLGLDDLTESTRTEELRFSVFLPD